jgi:hypothetical protein
MILPQENALVRFNGVVEFCLDLAYPAVPARFSVGIGKNRPSLRVDSAEGPACSGALPGRRDSRVESQHGQRQDGQKRDCQYQNVETGEKGRKLHSRLRLGIVHELFLMPLNLDIGDDWNSLKNQK